MALIIPNEIILKTQLEFQMTFGTFKILNVPKVISSQIEWNISAHGEFQGAN